MNVPRQNMRKILFTCALLSSGACLHLGSTVSGNQDLPLNKIRLPDGFEISIYASDVPGARSMAVGPNGTLFVGTRVGKVYAIVARKRYNSADEVITVARGLRMPNGVASTWGRLAVSCGTTISRRASVIRLRLW